MAHEIYGLIGHPAGHSLSPAMQNAAFGAIGVDAEYRLYDVEEARLVEFLNGVSHSGICGLNVTIPHKVEAKNYLERHGTLDETAKRAGAVNTIKVTNNGLQGFNTDGPGFYRSLIKDLKFEPEGKSIFVVGAGGASRAVVMYLGNGPKKMFVYDIDAKKAGDLKGHYGRYYDGKKFSVVRPEDIKDALRGADLLVQATPVGMKDEDPSPIDKDLLRPGMYVYDLVYNRPATRLVRDANAAKCHAATGLGMLLYQGVIAFEIWTGKAAPVEIMRKALREGLRRNAG